METKEKTKYLSIDSIQNVVNIAKDIFKQSPVTIINVIHQLEFIHNKYDKHNNNGNIFIKIISDHQLIGCLLLSSKYLEQHPYKLKPKTINKTFTHIGIKQICKIEIDMIKTLDYDIDYILSKQNIYYWTDCFLMKLKKENRFGLNEENYRKLCEISANTCVDLLYKLGTFDIDQYDLKTLACTIILFALVVINNGQIKRINNGIISKLIELSLYKSEKQLFNAVKDIDNLF
eukprot:553802_1